VLVLWLRTKAVRKTNSAICAGTFSSGRDDALRSDATSFLTTFKHEQPVESQEYQTSRRRFVLRETRIQKLCRIQILPEPGARCQEIYRNDKVFPAHDNISLDEKAANLIQ
jgi:hypothetical protein